MRPMLWLLLGALVVLRAATVRRFWRLPTAAGPAKFFVLDVPPDFYSGAGRDLLRGYRRAIVLPLAIDVAVIAVLLVLGRPVLIFYAQALAVVVSAVQFRMAAAHSTVRALALLAPPGPAAPSAVRISVESRRLRDHTRWGTEAVIAALQLVGIVCLLQRHPVPDAAQGVLDTARVGARAVQGAVWLLYAQLGLVCLKHLFVRARLRLPLRRADEYLRWRGAWLRYHLRVIDLFRTLLAAELAVLGARGLAKDVLQVRGVDVLVAAWLLGAALAVVLAVRERRRLARVEREVPHSELAREFPPVPIAPGRFAAGGFAYLERDNPAIVVRGPVGLAVNMANGATYLWVAYLLGLAGLVVWQAVR